MSGEIPFGRFSKDKRSMLRAPLSLDYVSAPTVYDALNRPKEKKVEQDCGSNISTVIASAEESRTTQHDTVPQYNTGIQNGYWDRLKRLLHDHLL